MTRGTFHPTRVLAALLLFGVGFGYVEAAVVVYLRALYVPIHQRLHPGRPEGDLFPVIRIDQLEAEGPTALQHLRIEVVREAATLVMLVAVGLALAHNVRQFFAAFLIAFGFWDLFFYLFLKVLLGWPESLFTWDLLFLLPVPWTGPVLAPMLISLSMIASGVFVLVRESAGRPFHVTWAEWSAIIAGGVIVVVAFCWDFRNIMAGGLPNPFPWLLFGIGEGVGLAGFLHALRVHLKTG